MNKKGEYGVGLMITVAITLIAGLVLYGAAVQLIGASTTTVALVNSSVTMPTNTSTIYLEGQSTSALTITNSTHDEVTDQYTITNNALNNGALTVAVTCVSETTCENQDALANVSYTYEPLGYIPSAGGRAMAGLIAVFAALAVVVVAMSPIASSGIKEFMGK